jgi:membrane protease YdiL (CAAX protease family)
MAESSTNLLSTTPGDYWLESTRPLVSLVFVAPMLAAYEGGLLVLGPHAMRNGADLWLRRLLEWVGFGQYFLLPLLTCGLLLAWHHVKREPWRLGWGVLSGMLLESTVLGLTLLILAYAQGFLLAQVPGGPACAVDDFLSGRLVAFFGAGIYEELLFRALLLPAVALAARAAGASRITSAATAVIATSLLFAAAHYRVDLMIGSYHLATSVGEPFIWTTFLFRFLAGVFFSLVFLYRGFGIAVGTHAFYDILVTLL